MFNFVSVLQEPAENIIKLRTTPPLFQAYEYAYSLLENSLCPLFHESDDVSNLMQKYYRFLINLSNLHFGPTDVESWVWYQLSWFLVTFLNHPRWKLGKGIAVGYSCFIFQFLDIIIVLPNHVLHNSCTASLNLCHINWVKHETCLKNYLLFCHVSCDSCLQILYETFFCMWTSPDTKMVRNFEMISDKFNVMVICTCAICVQNKSFNCMIIIL